MDVTVIIPTLNSLKMLKEHVEEMSAWISEVQAVISVDSGSTDGTVAYLRQKLKHTNFRSIQHPPGLYESWNAAIKQVQTKYVYIATSGDSISRGGLRILYDTAEANRAGVVISIPRMVNIFGEKKSGSWPIHRVIRALNIEHATKLSKQQMLFANLACFPGTLIGSSASNLYLTALLQAKPFPTDAGQEGDSAWAIEHAFDANWVILPESLATFLIHKKNVGTDLKPVTRIRFLRAYEMHLKRLNVRQTVSEGLLERTNDLFSTLLRMEQLRLKVKETQRRPVTLKKFMYKLRVRSLKKSLPKKRERVFRELGP